MPLISDFPLIFFRIFAVVFGLLWGSFLNVVIHRVPREESVVHPASRCPSCGKPIRPWNNIPVISWVLLRGKASCCGTKISPRYVVIELIGGILSLAVVEMLIHRVDSSESILRFLAMYAAGFALSLALTAASFIDLEHMYIPDTISYGATVLGLATISFRQVSLLDAIASSIGSFLVIWLVFGVGYKLIRGRTGMGMGDAKLLMVAGAWFGWRGAVFALLAGSVQGTVAVLATLLVKGRLEEPETVVRERQEILDEIASIEDLKEREEALVEAQKDPIFEETKGGFTQVRVPFGPFLALATIEYLLLEPVIVEAFERWISTE